ncbi:DUF1501 domain-containing protein [Sandaracinus amylolyticus]|uniref:Tat (Twin-arginine translocation) pathway signal sequence domain protein n=1 Tax=Sandaracinus amylolyticus TaxID=927083 RepID=A0A0F6YGC1_9BACT|nr:DUF1501 domain-containing protein [Sandaracinus amylolyticus]AKF03763.1 hypothetical protein DB32_000912 [Sandaracinus amylolyticus]
MKMSRRTLLAAGGVGAVQLGLLSRFGLLDGRARADCTTDRPTKLLMIMIPGGIHHELMWSVFHDDRIGRFIPRPDGSPIFYDASTVENLDGSGDADVDAPIRRVRMNVTWDRADPSMRLAEPGNKGYAWAAPEYRLWENTAIISGVDQGTAAHLSGQIASLCGVAGATFGAPAIPAVIANHFLDRFPDRAVPSVSIGGSLSGPALDLAPAAGPAEIANVGDLEYTLSDRRYAWNGLRTRTEEPALAFDGTPQGSGIPLTAVEGALLPQIRGLRGRSTRGTDTALEQLYEGYAGLSRTLARDIVDLVAATPGVEHLPASMPWAPGAPRFGWTIGYADYHATDATWGPNFDLALRMLKSDLTTAVSFRLPMTFNFDSHFTNPFGGHGTHLRGAFEVIGRLIAEMKLTPSTMRAGSTLLDDTLVYITSDFGRTFPITGGSDHNPMHSAVLVNGRIQGNRMLGGYEENGLGRPVELIGEDDERETRPPTSRDVAATIYSCFGFRSFIPGGYGIVDGVACP